MTSTSVGDALTRYKAVNDIFLDTYGQECLDVSYSSFIKQMTQTAWNTSAAVGGQHTNTHPFLVELMFIKHVILISGRQWTYQTCAEFGFFQSTDDTRQPFGQTVPVDFYIQQCVDIFGDQFNLNMLQDAVVQTNTNYGGRITAYEHT